MDVEVYKDIVKKCTKNPPEEKTVWAGGSGKLCIVFVEFRDMDIIKYNLWNLANVYGGTDASLFIVHSGENRDTIMDVVKDWKNVKCKEMFTNNITWQLNNKLFASVEFWDLFSEYEYILTNQWDSYVFKPVPEKFFKYEYVGTSCGHYYVKQESDISHSLKPGCNCVSCARGVYIPYNRHISHVCDHGCDCLPCLYGVNPWTAKQFDNHDDKYIMLCGGITLRKVSAMRRFCETHTWWDEPEDVFFCISDLSRPTSEEASEFGVNHKNRYDHQNPSCCHKIWTRGEEYVVSLFKECNT